EAGPATVFTYLAAAVVALVFQPIRRAANHLANRLEYGRRATPYEVLSELSDRMTGMYSIDEVLPRTARIVATGTGASSAQVWLRVGPDLRLAASWPTHEALGNQALRLTGTELPEIPGVSGAYPVRHHGEILGAITVTVDARDPLTPSKEKLIH